VLMAWASVKAQGIYGGLMPAEVAVPMIAPADIGSYAGGRLARLDFSGKSVVHLIGPKAITQTELVGILGQAIGKPVRYVQVSLGDVEQGLRQAGFSPSLVSAFMEMYRGAGSSTALRFGRLDAAALGRDDAVESPFTSRNRH